MSDDEDLVLVDEAPAPGKDLGPFGIEKDCTMPTGDLVLNEEEEVVAPPPTELEEQTKDGSVEDSVGL